jgi:Na+-transporting methylmalonyl-CoA/oxaloacetate decarboxylase gamma subunit
MTDDLEGCALVIAVVAVLALAVAFVSVVLGAPSLISEVFLDAFLMAGLYRRLRRATREHWLGLAVRKTWSSAIIVALGLSVAAAFLSWLAPGAHSIGPAIQRLRGEKPPEVQLENP